MELSTEVARSTFSHGQQFVEEEATMQCALTPFDATPLLRDAARALVIVRSRLWAEGLCGCSVKIRHK